MTEYSLDEENQKRYAARREEWKRRHAELLTEEPVIDKQKADLKTEIQMLHDKKAGLQEQMRDLENEEKLLTQKVYIELNGTDEEVERLRTVSENKKSLSKRTKELKEQILEKQEAYKSEAEVRILKDAIVKEIKLSKKMNPASVDMVESTLRDLKEKYGIMPEGVVFSPARVPDGTALYNWLDDKLYLSNRFADVDGYLDVVKQSESSLAEYRKHYRIEETAKERMENADKILADRSVKGYERSKAILEKADVEIDLNIFRQGVRENLSDAIVHEYGHFIQRHANVDYVQKKNVFGMKDLGGKLVGGDWEYEINTAYSRAGKVEASKISKYATKNPYETFAEGFLAMHKGEKIPDGIEKVISEAMQKSNAKPIAKTTDSGIMKLPKYENAVIPKAKFTQYALNPEKDPDKAKAFEKALGYTMDNVDELISQIYDKISEYDAREKPDNGWGKRYEVIMDITGINGKTAKVLTAWIDDKNTGEMRLTSVYVDKE